LRECSERSQLGRAQGPCSVLDRRHHGGGVNPRLPRERGRDCAGQTCTSIGLAMRRRAWQKRKRVLLAAVNRRHDRSGPARLRNRPALSARGAVNRCRASRSEGPAGAGEGLRRGGGSTRRRSTSCARTGRSPRRYHAVVIDHLLAAGAKVIAFDIQCHAENGRCDDNAPDRGRRPRPQHGARDRCRRFERTDGRPRRQRLLKEVGARAGNSTVQSRLQSVFRNMQHSYQSIDTFAVAIASDVEVARSARSCSAAPSIRCRSTTQGRPAPC